MQHGAEQFVELGLPGPADRHVQHLSPRGVRDPGWDGDQPGAQGRGPGALACMAPARASAARMRFVGDHRAG